MALSFFKKPQNFAKRIQAVADKADLKVVEASENLVVAYFAMPEGRKQKVFMVPLGQLRGSTIFGICSVAKQVTGDLEARLANRLLRENGKHKVGYWGIMAIGSDSYLVCGHSLVLETLDPEELKVIAFTVAGEADHLEDILSQGGDQF